MNPLEKPEQKEIEWLESPTNFFHTSLSGHTSEISAIYNKKDRIVTISRSLSQGSDTETTDDTRALSEQLVLEARKTFGDDIAIVFV